MEGFLSGHLGNGIDGQLTALCIALTVAVQHLEGNLFDLQRGQCAALSQAGIAGIRYSAPSVCDSMNRLRRNTNRLNGLSGPQFFTFPREYYRREIVSNSPAPNRYDIDIGQ
jgi:hypothetical protein